MILRGREDVPEGPFVINNAANSRGIPLDQPARTITTQAGHWQLVREGDREDEVRQLTVPELLCAMGFPRRYKLPRGKADCVKLIGNAVPPPVSRELVGQIVRRG